MCLSNEVAILLVTIVLEVIAIGCCVLARCFSGKTPAALTGSTGDVTCFVCLNTSFQAL